MRVLWFSDRVWRAILLAVAVALRFIGLGRADLWTDEIQTLHAIRLGWGELVRERLQAGHAPLYFLAEKAWCSLAGESQFALRVPSALAGVALLIPAWSMLRRLLGESGAWWGTALLALHPLFVELSREARMYPLLALAFLVAADRAVAALDGERAGVSFWIAAAAGPLIHPTWGMAALPFLAWMLLERRSASAEARRSSLAAVLGIGASLVLLAAVLSVSEPQRQVLTRRPWPRELGVFALRVFAGSDLRLFHSPLAMIGVLAPWTLHLVRGCVVATPRVRSLAFALGAGATLMSLVAGVAEGLPWGPARYVQIAVVGLAALYAASAAAMSADRGRNSRAPVLLLSMFLVSLYPVASPLTAWQDAARAIGTGASPVVVDDEHSRIVLAHYLGRDVSAGSPPPGAAAWLHASLDVSAGDRRVTLTPESAR